MTVEVALIISLVSVSFSVFSVVKNSKRTDIKDVEERVRENTRINMKLDGIAATMNDIKQEFSSTKEDIKQHNDRLTTAETDLKSIHRRLDDIESRLNVRGD